MMGHKVCLGNHRCPGDLPLGRWEGRAKANEKRLQSGLDEGMTHPWDCPTQSHSSSLVECPAKLSPSSGGMSLPDSSHPLGMGWAGSQAQACFPLAGASLLQGLQ